jgi:hypothetical protein
MRHKPFRGLPSPFIAQFGLYRRLIGGGHMDRPVALLTLHRQDGLISVAQRRWLPDVVLLTC